MDAFDDQCGALRDPSFVNLVVSMYVLLWSGALRAMRIWDVPTDLHGTE